MGGMIEFGRPDGGHCRGYLADAGKGRPAVIVIQEWWGLNEQICGIVDRYAAAGFTALAPDLFKGRVTQNPDEASHLMNGLDFAGATHQDIRGAAQYLVALGGASCAGALHAGDCASRAGKVGITGYCMGGALTIAAAVHVPEVAAAVCLYGIPPRDFADPANIRVPFQGHFATRDAWCTPQAVAELEARMRAQGATPEIFHYDADHAFCNEKRPEVYDAKCAAAAWTRTLAFFGTHL